MLERIARDAGVTPVPTVSDEALRLLSGYAFPGNVRELENLLQRALALSGSEVIEWQDLGLAESSAAEPLTAALDDLPRASPLREIAAELGACTGDAAPLPSDLQAYLDQVERDILMRALERYRYNRTAAGASLGLSLRQMRYRMARLGVITGEGPGERGDPGLDAPGVRDGGARRRHASRPISTRGRPPRPSRWWCCTRSACRLANTVATPSSGSSATASTGMPIRTTTAFAD